VLYPIVRRNAVGDGAVIITLRPADARAGHERDNIPRLPYLMERAHRRGLLPVGSARRRWFAFGAPGGHMSEFR
jgi:hypothetical protein